MAIYRSSRVYPYVYKLTHKQTGQFYIGYQFANKVPSSSSIGTLYFTSSSLIHEMGFQNFDVEIIAEFFTAAAAYEFEQQVILENINNRLILNKQCFPNGKFVWGKNTSGWTRTEEYLKKMGDAVKTALAKPATKLKRSKANSGVNNPRTIHVMFKGIEYQSQQEAIKATGLSKYLLRRHPEYSVMGRRRDLL